MSLESVHSPSVVWSQPVGYLRRRGVTIELEAPPPIESLRAAEGIHWEPRTNIRKCSVGRVRRDLTDAECDALDQWTARVAKAALDALP